MKLGKNNKDKNKDKKKKGIVGRMIKIFTFLSTLPFIFNMLMILISIALLFVAAAGILQFFHEDDPIVNEYEIDWGNYTCSCTFLTAEQILQVQAGNQVEVDLTNGGSLNITGGSVVTVAAHGKKITDSSLNQWDLPLYDGLTMDATQLGCNSWEIDFNSNDYLKSLSTKYAVTQETRAHEGLNYEKVNYGPYAKEGSKLPFTEVDGRISIAMTWRYNTSTGKDVTGNTPPSEWNASNVAGRYCDIVFTDGTVLAAIFGSSKGNEDGNQKYNSWAHHDGSVIEIVQYTDYNYGDLSSKPDGNQKPYYLYAETKGKEAGVAMNGYTGPQWKTVLGNRDIAKVIVYDVHHYNESSNTYTQWFTEKSATSVSTENTTTSFGATGTGSNQATSTTTTTISSNIDVSNFNLTGETTPKGFVIVEGTGGSSCVVSAYKKNGSTWEKFVDTNGVLGENGMSNNKTEGDKTTPIGIWKMNTPFGQKEALDGFPSSYLKVSESSDGTDMPDYWSGSTGNESYGYNKLKLNFDTTIASDFIGERISSSGYSGYYNYVIDSGYNYNGAYKAGSALFLHCNANGATSTSGCVAIPESEMIKILKEYEDDCWYIVQAPKGYIFQLYNAYGVNNGLSPDGDFGIGSTNTSSSSTFTNDNTTSVTVNSNTSTYTNGQKISLDSSWEYASESAIYSGSATYYTATTNRNNICVAVNAGHGCTGGSSKKTKTHPDGTGKYMGGTTEKGALTSVAISSGMDFADGTSEASVNLKVAKYMKDELLSMGYDVLMIRETDDEQLDNIARTVIANNVADCHVAIHFDSSSSNIGAYYVRVPDVDAYKNMEPVKTWWQKHDELGEALLIGLSNNGSSIRGTNGDGIDLSQTSYSTIPSADIELGDKLTPHEDADCQKFAKGLALGVDEFYKTNTPVNQSKRVGSVLSNSTSSSTSTSISNTVVSGIVNKNKNNLRTECSMATEGICGCYVSDPNCMCHIFGGSDGVLGTSDDNTEAIQEEIQSNAVSTTGEYALKVALEVFNAMYQNGAYGSDPYNQGRYGSYPIVINGETLYPRWDCSGYIGTVLKVLGAPWITTNKLHSFYTGTFSEWCENGTIKNSDSFIVLEWSRESLQPGDIMTADVSEMNALNSSHHNYGHVQIFSHWSEAGNTNSTMMGYSWGSDNGINSYPKDDAKNITGPHSIYSNYKYIIRYVGSGGTGK